MSKQLNPPQSDTTPDVSEELKVDVGGGRHPEPGHVNVDLRELPEVDIVAAHDLPFDDNTVDRLYCNSLIPHLEDINRAFAEWSRVLAPGGELVVKATHSNSTGIYDDADHNHWSWTSATPRYFDVDSEFSYYNDAALSVVDVDVIGWARPEKDWLRPLSAAYKLMFKTVSPDVADELAKLPFAGARVIARFEA